MSERAYPASDIPRMGRVELSAVGLVQPLEVHELNGAAAPTAAYFRWPLGYTQVG